MKEFCILITETLSRPVMVKAETQEEAEQKAITAYYSCEVVLDTSDFVDVNFETQDSNAVDRMSEESKQRLKYVK